MTRDNNGVGHQGQSKGFTSPHRERVHRSQSEQKRLSKRALGMHLYLLQEPVVVLVQLPKALLCLETNAFFSHTLDPGEQLALPRGRGSSNNLDHELTLQAYVRTPSGGEG